jgi:hypothetical protein
MIVWELIEDNNEESECGSGEIVHGKSNLLK